MSLLGRLQQDVDVIIAEKTNAEMFTIETFTYSSDLLFSSVYLKNEKLLVVILMLSQALQAYLLLEVCNCLLVTKVTNQ